MFLAKVTLKMAVIVVALDTTKMIVMPNLSLMLCVCILMVADFVTGLIKAKVLKQVITSEKMRHSIVKFLQYFGCIGIVVVLLNQKLENPTLTQALHWAYDGLTILILYIESLSILENLYMMDGKNPFARNVIRPLYFILSLVVKNNPLKKEEDELRRKIGQASGDEKKDNFKDQKNHKNERSRNSGNDR